MNIVTLDNHFKQVATAQEGISAYFFGFTDQLNLDNLGEEGNLKGYPLIHWVPPFGEGNKWENIHQNKYKWIEFVLYCWRQMDTADNVTQELDNLAKGYDDTETLLAQFVRKAFEPNLNPLKLQIADGGEVLVEYGQNEYNDRLIGTKFTFEARPAASCANGEFFGLSW